MMRYHLKNIKKKKVIKIMIKKPDAQASGF